MDSVQLAYVYCCFGAIVFFAIGAVLSWCVIRAGALSDRNDRIE